MCVGAMGLILYTYPWLGLAFIGLGFLLVSGNVPDVSYRG